MTTQLRVYKEELTAAAVYQVVDSEYSKVGFAQRTYQPTPCTCAQPAETRASTAHSQEDSMSSRPSTYHTETLAENRRLQEKVQRRTPISIFLIRCGKSANIKSKALRDFGKMWIK